MSARKKGARKRQLAPPNTTTPSTESPAAASRQRSTERAFDECVGAICLVEVTLHSLESQEIASPEQEVLKRALKAIWIVHDWIDGLRSNDLDGEGTDLEDDEP